MEGFKRFLGGIVYLFIGIAFWALVRWETKLSFAAGSYGGTTLKDAPGLYCALLVWQVVAGGWFLNLGVESLRGRPIFPPVDKDHPHPTTTMRSIATLLVGGIGAGVCLLSIWAVYDLAVNAFHAVFRPEDELVSKLITGGFVFGSLGVLVYLLFAMIFIPFWKYAAPRVHGAAQQLLRRT